MFCRDFSRKTPEKGKTPAEAGVFSKRKKVGEKKLPGNGGEQSAVCGRLPRENGERLFRRPPAGRAPGPQRRAGTAVCMIFRKMRGKSTKIPLRRNFLWGIIIIGGLPPKVKTLKMIRKIGKTDGMLGGAPWISKTRNTFWRSRGRAASPGRPRSCSSPSPP